MSEALAYLKSGLSVIPCNPETKRPKYEWAAYQSSLPDEDTAKEWFKNGAAIGVICGPVSGNLEIIDIEEYRKPGLTKSFRELLKKWNCDGIWKKCVIEQSQRGGFHLAYRFKGAADGNQKLALSKNGDCLIETRGNGGYCIIAPSEGYTIRQGKWTELPILTPEEREALLAASRMFDEFLPPIAKTTDRIGDDYNRRASIDEIVIPLGWQRCGSRGEEQFFVRPGKDPREGISATYNWKGTGNFRIFTSSCGLEPRMYDKWGLYVRLHHNGDFKAAAIAASKSGYGVTAMTPAQVRTTTGPRRVLCMEDVEEEEMDFLIEPYFPLGVGYTLLYGDSDQGKSTVTLALVAGWSRGECPITRKSIPPVRSLILSGEDSAQFVVKPRLKQLGADMKMVFAPEEFREENGVLIPDPMVLDELGAEELQTMIRENQIGVVVIDPLTSYFDGDSINDRLQARVWTRRITNIAIAERCVPIIVHHVSKPNGASGGRYRAAGSQDFFDAARSGLMVCHAGEGTTEYALSHEKHNYSWRGESIGYEFSREKGFQWTGYSDLTADLAAARQEEHVEPGKKEACKKWLLEVLESGPMSSEDLWRGARLEGFKYATYRRAKDELRDQTRSWKSAEKDGPWMLEIRRVYDPYAD